jgi:hypothetical protein
MRWLFDNFGLIFLAVVVFSIWRRALSFLRQAAAESERRGRERPANYDPAEDDRVRKIQEEIRRKIAERRGEPGAPAPARNVEDAPPVLTRSALPPVDPFGGPGRKIFNEVDRRLNPSSPVAETREPVRADAALLERQERLAEQLRQLQEARALKARRAAEAAAALTKDEVSERGDLVRSRDRLLRDLRDPRSLRRAFVVREVLSAPVGLR